MARVVNLKNSSAAREARGREDLVEVAVELFARNGFAGTSIRDIADAVGRSVSNVYHYFENKEALWLAILERSVKALPGRLRGALEGIAEPRARIAALVREHLDVSEQYRRESRIFFIDEERLSASGNKANKRIQREILSIYVAELEGLRAAGLLADGDTRVTAFNMLGVINWYLRWSKPSAGGAKREQTVDQVLAFILRGATGSER
ncbi:MAG: TetR/AcrR family transcriptional regulator [Sphingomonadaceae bacterium]|nr:TetR/AcrR family transcriptional regulator [Sphingomonadaceae bacterium]